MATTDKALTASPLRVALSWAIVVIPLTWGVVQSVVKSMPLFQASKPQPPSK